MNQVNIIGRLTADPVLSYTQGGTACCKFSIAYNEIYVKDGEKINNAHFFNVVAWQKQAETVAEYFKKGQRIGITGKIQQRRWQDQNGNDRSVVEIVLNGFDFIESMNNGNKHDAPQQDAGKQSNVMDGQEVPAGKVPSQTPNNPFSDEDIPF